MSDVDWSTNKNTEKYKKKELIGWYHLSVEDKIIIHQLNEKNENEKRKMFELR